MVESGAKMEKEQISKYASITRQLSEGKKDAPKYAPITMESIDYRKLPPIPDSWCDRKARPVKSQKKDQWKYFVANYID